MLLVLLLLICQVSAAASGSQILSQVFSPSVQGHHDAEDSADHQVPSKFTEELQEADQRSAQSHEHKHRHSQGEPEHDHSHNHFAGYSSGTCLVGGAGFQLNLHMDVVQEFPLYYDQVIQPPFLSSVFRPPII